MKKLLILLLIVLFPKWFVAQEYKVTGGIGAAPFPYSENIVGTEIEKIYLLNTLTGAEIKYTSSAASVKFYRYQNSESDKVQIPTSEIPKDGNTYTITNLIDSRGYFAEVNGNKMKAVWIIDYAIHQPVLTAISVVESDDKCERIKLFITKSDELSFYSKNGSKMNIPRKYTISYENKVWNEGKKEFETKTISLKDITIGTERTIDSPPLMNTRFTLKGDQFGTHFGIAKEISSTEYQAIAVDPHIVYEQEGRDETSNEPLGGSAPVTINFDGIANDPIATYYTWYIYKGDDRENAVARYTDNKIKYTFDQSGEYTVRLEVTDQNSTCTSFAEEKVEIWESDLQIPNYFSPGDSPGINDEFKVYYKSLVKYKCTIFNRWGVKLYESSDPAKGWDGKYKGNYVNTGAYYYVIEALGSDGRKYKKGGDINILRSK